MSRSFTPDQELVDRIAFNDTDAFEELYRRYWYSLYSYSLKKLQSSEDARKLVRDIFVQLWENRKSLLGDFSLPQHLYTTVRQDVVKALAIKLEDEDFAEILERKIGPEFSAQALRQAKMPMIRKYTAYKPPMEVEAPVIKLKTQRQHTLANMKWLFQLVNAKLHS